MARRRLSPRTLPERFAYHIGLGPLMIVLHAQRSLEDEERTSTTQRVPATAAARRRSQRSNPTRTARLA